MGKRKEECFFLFLPEASLRVSGQLRHRWSKRTFPWDPPGAARPLGFLNNLSVKRRLMCRELLLAASSPRRLLQTARELAKDLPLARSKLSPRRAFKASCPEVIAVKGI